jgi:hypothetical protein
MKDAKRHVTTLFNMSCKTALVRLGVLGGLLLGQVAGAASVYADEGLPAEYRPSVYAFIDAAKTKDHQAIARQISYPLKREYPLAAINNQQEMLTRFDEVFDDALLGTIAQSGVEQDWQSVGWRGIMLGNGEVWMDYDGKIIGVNYQTPLEARLKASLIAKQKSALHPSLREYERPELMWQTDKFMIRIDDMGNGQYRYASWNKGKSLNEKPDLVLKQGRLLFDGSGGNHSFQFKSGPYQYHCEVIVMGENDSQPGALVVYKNGIEILRQPVLAAQ